MKKEEGKNREQPQQRKLERSESKDKNPKIEKAKSEAKSTSSTTANDQRVGELDARQRSAKLADIS